MSRAALVRLILALLVLGGSAAIALQAQPRLGLDLRGGTQIVLETSDSETGVVADAEATDRTLEVLRGRVDALGVAEPTLARAGENRIIIELPGLQDPAEASEVIGRTAQLSFHPVIEAVGPRAQPREGERIFADARLTHLHTTDLRRTRSTIEPTAVLSSCELASSVSVAAAGTVAPARSFTVPLASSAAWRTTVASRS